MTITTCRIHPAIGVARVGDSPDEYFVGPERPGPPQPPPGGNYKDRARRVKRQAARFRIFGYDRGGNVVRELTHAEADIRWTVHLANRKAAAAVFARRPDARPAFRNQAVPGDRRASLVIDPGERSVSGPGAHSLPDYRFDTGTFGCEPVDLGELRTDDAGRLLVLGGHGRSGSPDGLALEAFADNDGWFDDTSDGPVRASVTLRDTGLALPVVPSWVIVAPPDFAPSLANVVTLHDVVEQVAYVRGSLPEPRHVSFEQDIYPLLERAAGYQWVDPAGYRGHRRGDHSADDAEDAEAVERRGDFLDAALLALLRSPDGGEAAENARHRVFRRVRAPLVSTTLADPEARAAAEAQEKEQATAAFMPPLSGDGGRRREGDPARWLTVTPLQYKRLQLWARGDFRAGADDAPGASGAAFGAEPTPADLDRAALDNCVGGGFFPGIEVSGRIRDASLYVEDDLRLNHDHKDLQPGALTERMAVPWQADFADCEGFWWPAQRPDQVITLDDYVAVVEGTHADDKSGPATDALAFPRRRWARGIGNGPASATESSEEIDRRYRDMVGKWGWLGFVVPRATRDGQIVWTETERERYWGLRDRDYFHIMLNLDQHPDFRPTARELATRFFAQARHDIEHDEELDSELRFFDYDEAAFTTRLDSIYHYLVDDVARYNPKQDENFPTREDVIERIRQFAPLNQTDGAWLRNVEKIRPQTEVTELLSRIWRDEIGGGDLERNHAEIYTRLMRSVGLDPAPVASAAYAQDPALLDSAFTVPLLQYVASEFTEDFLPEILGMTLHFEWESVGLKTNVELFRRDGIDPTFYRLHLAIDNVAEGHGALATRAVRRYLADFQGEDLQERWRRMWDGYVAFRDAGTLFDDLMAKLHPKPDPALLERRVKEMIERKKPYGNLNHGGVRATGMTNDLFDDPAHLLRVLREREIVVPGRPDDSLLVRTFAIDGAMHQVFTEEEQQLWRDWITSLPAAAPAPATPAPATAAAGGRAPRHHKRLLLSSSAAAFRADTRRRLRGRGAVQ
jgi:hypothetical protein